MEALLWTASARPAWTVSGVDQSGLRHEQLHPHDADVIQRVQDTRRDQHRIRQRADQAQHEDMLAQQPLPQDKGVLRADRDNERSAEQEAGSGSAEGAGQGMIADLSR